MSVRCRLCVEHFLEREEFARHIEAHAESLENNGADPSIKSCGLKLQFVNNQRSPGSVKRGKTLSISVSGYFKKFRRPLSSRGGGEVRP